jgi:hypothetical protein
MRWQRVEGEQGGYSKDGDRKPQPIWIYYRWVALWRRLYWWIIEDLAIRLEAYARRHHPVELDEDGEWEYHMAKRDEECSD